MQQQQQQQEEQLQLYKIQESGIIIIHQGTKKNYSHQPNNFISCRCSMFLCDQTDLTRTPGGTSASTVLVTAKSYVSAEVVLQS